MTTNPYIIKDGDKVTITEEGYRKLSEFVTDTRGDVYAFTGTLSQVKVAAAMARLSRRMGDMRETILDEFMLGDGDDENRLIQRVVSQFGDDSVQQLAGMHVVVEGASNLLTKIIEWGRPRAYLEQSTRYIFYDKRDAEGKYRYFIPELPLAIKGEYIKTMDTTFDLYSHMVHGLTEYLRKKYPEPEGKKERAAWINSTRAAACDAVRSVLPTATRSTVGIYANAQSLERMIIQLRSNTLEEARISGNKVLREARKVMPAFLERADLPSQGNMIGYHMAKTKTDIRDLARRYLNFGEAKSTVAGVKLLSYWPPSELDLVPEILFDQAEPLSLSEIERQVAEFSYDQKVEVLRAYIGDRTNRRQRPGRAFEKAHFEFEIVGDYGTFRDLQRHRIVDSWEWQLLNPYFGYDVPELVTEAGFENEFNQCFELSKRLYEILIAVSPEVAQYAVLMGHRMRYRFIMNLRQLFHFIELRTGPSGHPGYRRICNQGHDIVGDVYPISADAMIFTDKSNESELGRLDAELRTQNKLEKLEDK